MAKVNWDNTGDRYFEMGVNQGVLYVQNKDGTYGDAVAWNGLTGVTESPEGAEPTDLWADNIKYATLRSAETFGGTIEAYTYPDEFMQCDGSGSPVVDDAAVLGIRIGQQERKAFGLCYRTAIGNDVDPSGKDYLLHLVYGATASPSEKAYETINDSPDAITFSWEFTTNPVKIAGEAYKDFKPVSTIVIDSRKFSEVADKAKLDALEDLLYGTDASGNDQGTTGTLPAPDVVISTLTA